MSLDNKKMEEDMAQTNGLIEFLREALLKYVQETDISGFVVMLALTRIVASCIKLASEDDGIPKEKVLETFSQAVLTTLVLDEKGKH